MNAHLRLLGYVRPHGRTLMLVVLLMGFQVGLEILRPWPVKLLVDQVLGEQPLSPAVDSLILSLPGATTPSGLLLWVCLGTVAIFLAATLTGMLSNYLLVSLGHRATYSLGSDLLLHLQQLSLLFHNRRPAGDSIARVTEDVHCVQTLLSRMLLPALQSGVMLVAMFAVMWRLQPRMTLLSLGVVPFLVLTIWGFGGRLKGTCRVRAESEGRMISVVQQTLQALPAVQAFHRQRHHQERFRSTAHRTVRAHQGAVLADMRFRLAGGTVTAVGTAGIMWMGATYALEGDLSVGTILVFLSYLASLYQPLNELTYSASTFQSAAAGADRVREVLDTLPDVREAPDALDAPLAGRVRFEEVWFGYEPDRPVSRGVTFEAAPGELVAIVGPTGAGKSTLLNLLIRLVDPWKGSLTIDGIDLRRLRLETLRRQVAVVLQEPFLFPISIAENIGYGRPGATRDQIEAAAGAAGAAGFIARLPQGYDTVVGEGGATLSGGERQRLAIARALLKDAPILFMDEPTSALDARTEASLLAAMERLRRERTVLVIAHRLSTIHGADRIVVLDEGRIVEQGRHEELVALGGLYARLYHRQADVADQAQ